MYTVFVIKKKILILEKVHLFFNTKLDLGEIILIIGNIH